MSTETGKMIWRNGELVSWEQATIHVMSHVVNYGSSLFEGVRCYETADGPAIFRLGDHIKRFLNSCHIYRMKPRFGYDELCEACVNLVATNEFSKGCYLRPIAFRGYGTFGVNPFPAPIEVYIATWAWGKYLGEEALEQGVDVCVSSWTRLAPNTFPAMAKSGANYMNSQLIKMEAVLGGFSEGIALDDRGYVSEGSGENLFVVNGGRLITPPLGASILPGITRDSVIQIAREMGIEVVETQIQRAALYLADEVFFTGTAAEISPIRSVDRITVGSGKRGEMTEALQSEFFKIIDATRPAPFGAEWLTFVNTAGEKKTAGAK